jgi:hypothetical protein
LNGVLPDSIAELVHRKRSPGKIRISEFADDFGCAGLCEIERALVRIWLAVTTAIKHAPNAPALPVTARMQ